MSKHRDFILTDFSEFIEDSVQLSQGISLSIGSYGICEYVFLTLFLKLTGASEQKMKCLCWEMGTEDYEFRRKYLEINSKYGEMSNDESKKYVFQNLVKIITKADDSFIVENFIDKATILKDVKEFVLTIFKDTMLSSWNLRDYNNFEEIYDKVFLPESLEEIGSSAFSSCSNLTDVVLPANNNLKTIGSNAFYNCPKLENIVNFDNVEYLGISAFISGLDDITATTPAWYINQAPGLVYVGKVALRYRGDMPENTTITLKPNTTMIAEYCFFNQSNLVAIDCGDSLRYISKSPFLSCTNLKKFTLNNGNLHLENIAKNAFNSCSFNELHITDLASWIYSYDTPSTTLDNVGKYDDQYPEIYYNANYDNLVFKAANVYVNGSKLEQLNVPEGVTTIHSNMVEGCSSLKSVHIPSTCSRITGNSGVFFNSPLETITIAEGNTAYRVRDNALYRKVDFYRDTMIVENPYYSPFVTIYKFTDWILEKGSKSTSVIQPVAKIVDYAFSRTRNPNLLTFEEGTKKIGKYAFSHCNFKKVVLPHSLIELGDYAFNWCNNLEEVVIGPQKPTFGHQPFVNCAKLSTIRLYIKDPSVFTGNASSSVFPAGCVIYVPRGSGESYRSTPYFTGYEIREFDDAPKGDVDGNGVVDGIDLNTMINFILGKSSPSATQLEIADFDGDGAIDGTDLNQMINTILGQ